MSNSADFFCAVFIDNLEVQNEKWEYLYSETLKDCTSQSMNNLVVKMQVYPAASYICEGPNSDHWNIMP